MKDLKARHDSLRKIAVVLMCMCLILVGTMFVACDSQEDLTPYRKTKIGEIQSYAAAKIQCEYSESNVAAINEIVENGKRSVNKSKSRTDIDSTVINTRQALDMIEPLRSEEIRDGVYFMTDIGYEWFRTCHFIYKGASGCEGDVNFDYEEHKQEYKMDSLYAMIINGQIILSHDSASVYSITKESDIYKLLLPIERLKSEYIRNMWLTDDILYVRYINTRYDSCETYQYKLDPTIDTTEIVYAKQLEMPSSADIVIKESRDSISLTWGYIFDKYGKFGALTELKNDEYSEYTPVTISREGIFKICVIFKAYRHTDNEKKSNQLNIGEHFIRVCNLGGYYLREDKTVGLCIQSEFLYFKITVTSDNMSVEQIIS